MTNSNGFTSPPVDFELLGIVGIRLINARPSDVVAVTSQLGYLHGRLDREPDILIEFVDHLPISSPLHYIGVEDTAYTEAAFFVLRSKHKSRALVQIPFEDIGQQCHIRCETGLKAVPLLIPILNLTALSRGLLPLHASAFDYQGIGVLTTGWSKGGKTETLLAFMAQGANYVGDEWIYITEDGQHMCGIPEPIRVWDWHLESMPDYRLVLGRKDKMRLHTLKTASQFIDRTTANGMMQKSVIGKLMKRISPLINQQMHVDLPPRKLFGPGRESRVATIDKVVFVASHAAPEITVKPMDAVDIAQRMVFSLQEERQNFMSYYYKFRFAFPKARNPFIENVEEVEQTLLTRLLANKDAYAIHHPYPVELSALYTAIEPLLYQDNNQDNNQDNKVAELSLQ